VIVLDTHVLLWLDAASARLGNRARNAIDKAFQAGKCAVSAISFWEVGMLVYKERIRISLDPEEWRSELLEQGLLELPVTGEIGIRAAALRDFVGDPADRLIVATARKHGAKLVTADGAILKASRTVAVMDASR
jgi:PIN domain nuclease of toxin-antitoxin system